MYLSEQFNHRNQKYKLLINAGHEIENKYLGVRAGYPLPAGRTGGYLLAFAALGQNAKRIPLISSQRDALGTNTNLVSELRSYFK
ncbi:MAG: hypothetical protein EON51_18395 [Acinetobacter sp.]|nr:MAG: hypothetical protein EON51_18395 [Acinetobacter sp.]